MAKKKVTLHFVFFQTNSSSLANKFLEIVVNLKFVIILTKRNIFVDLHLLINNNSFETYITLQQDKNVRNLTM